MELIEIFQQILKCKWTLMILDRLYNVSKRPGELRRSIKGLSSKVMYERLKMLENKGIIKRKLIYEKPLEVRYELTERGHKITELINQIRNLE